MLPERNRVRLQTVCVNQHGDEVLSGEAWIMPSRTRVVYEGRAEPEPAWTRWPAPVDVGRAGHDLLGSAVAVDAGGRAAAPEVAPTLVAVGHAVHQHGLGPALHEFLAEQDAGELSLTCS